MNSQPSIVPTAPRTSREASNLNSQLSSLEWFPVIRSGDDLLVPRTAATWFGGDSDPGDNGETASGVPTKGHPALLGCALPLAGYGLQSLRGTPLPMMAFGLHHDGRPNPDGAWVEVSLLSTLNHPLSTALTLPVIDLGPSLRTRHGIDLTVAAFKHFAGNLSQGVITVSYRLKRGALYLKSQEPSNESQACTEPAERVSNAAPQPQPVATIAAQKGQA